MLDAIIKIDSLCSWRFWLTLLEGWAFLQLIISVEKSTRQKQGWQKEPKRTDSKIIETVKVLIDEKSYFETEEEERDWIRKKLQKATPEQKETVMQYLKSLRPGKNGF